jgi:fructuronate reductase
MTATRLDRSSWPAPLRPARIVHIGVGNFSRAHQAWYTAADPTRTWGILGFTGRRPDLADALAPQQGLYTLIERGPLTDRVSVIDAVCEVRPGTDLDGLVEALASPQTSIVTLTVTEAGYDRSPAPGSGLPSAPATLREP